MKKRILSALAAILLVIFTSASPAAAYSIDKPSPIYIGDYANVIDADTENYIAREAANLDDMCGAQIVIITVDFLNGEEIENVAYQIFNDWGIGNAQRNNGVLLLMAIVDDDYWCMVGKGIEDDPLDETVLSYLLDEYLEPDFAARNYSQGALRFFDAVYDKLYDYYRGGVNPSPTPTPGPSPSPSPTPTPGPDTDETASAIATLILIVLLVMLVVTLTRKSYARRYPGVYRTRPLQFWIPRAPRVYYRPGYRPTGSPYNTYNTHNTYNPYPNGHQPSGNSGSGWGSNNNHNNNSGSSSSSGHYGSGSFGGGSSYGGGVGRSSRSSGNSGRSYGSGSSSKSSFGSTHSSSSSSYSSGSSWSGSSSSYSSGSSSHSSGGGGSSSGGGAGRHK